MIKLKTLLLEGTIDQRINDIISQIKSLPNSDVDVDLFGPENKKKIMLPFFERIKELLPKSEELRSRLRPQDLEGTPLEVYNVLNYSKHQVRNFLILQSNGLINEISFFSWSAIVLDSESHEKLVHTFRPLIPDGWQVIAHHMTINFNHQTPNNDLGQKITLKVTEYGLSDKALAVKVEGYKGETNSSFPHVTIAIDKEHGAKPKNSNDIKEWKPVTVNLVLTGIVRNL